MKKQTISSREQKKNSFYLITTTGTVQYSIYCNCFFTLTHSNGHGQSHRKSVATKAIEKDEFNLFFQIDRGNELNKFCPPNRRNDLCICFCLHPSSMGDRLGV